MRNKTHNNTLDETQLLIQKSLKCKSKKHKMSFGKSKIIYYKISNVKKK